ncbi:MAG: alpha/beta fold hydrolase [Acidimicrobiia bacterium]
MRVPLAVRALSAGALQAWFTPPPLSERRAMGDKLALAAVEGVTVPFQGGELAGFSIGEGPLALAVHGWGGRAAQMLPLAGALAERGNRVVAVDLPGHAGGTRSDVKVIARAVTAVVEAYGPPRSVIAHSLGAMATRLAFAESAPPLVVFLAPCLVVGDAIDVFSTRARLLPWAERGLRRGLRSWDPELFPRLDDITIEQLPGADLLILHDPDDPETLFARSAELAARRERTEIVPVDDVGHSGLLADPGAIDLVGERVTDMVGGSTGARAQRVTSAGD